MKLFAHCYCCLSIIGKKSRNSSVNVSYKFLLLFLPIELGVGDRDFALNKPYQWRQVSLGSVSILRWFETLFLKGILILSKSITILNAYLYGKCPCKHIFIFISRVLKFIYKLAQLCFTSFPHNIIGLLRMSCIVD